MDTDDSSITHPSPLRVVNEDGATRLVLSGTVGVTEATDLHRAALEAVARPGRVVVDWSQADGIDTAIAQLLISLAAALKDDGRTLDLSPAPRGIEAFLHRVALHDTLLTQR
jgi:ABC-type transporter Mla MlaB component